MFLVPIGFSLLTLLLCPSTASSGSDYDYGAHPRFVCTPIPADADPACFPTGGPGVGAAGPSGPGHQSAPPAGWWGASEEAKATILHLRESLVQQKETILDQRETIRELTAKLTLCEGLGRGVTPHDEFHGTGHHGNLIPDSPHFTSVGGQRADGGMLQALKERLDNLQVSNNRGNLFHLAIKTIGRKKRSTKENITQLMNRKEEVGGVMEQIVTVTFHTQDTENQAQGLASTQINWKQCSFHSPDAFQISFPIRTNYMYGRVKRTLMQEIFALTLCLWIKAGVGPGLGTPFSYSAPGQANELVLIEWGNNPMELLIDDKAVALPLTLGDAKWHHVCVTWSTRDGQWEAYQDGVQRGSGINLSPWHPIKPGGVFILGQEQDTLGGRFDATQSFVGELSDVHMWSHVLTASDIYSLASCGSHLRGDVMAWSESEVEVLQPRFINTKRVQCIRLFT
uniref:Si:dkey-283b15.2 n=1 Tax=Cyclopterus lumpus TaxID=8103 RepID=A0A8C3AN14_CYCLU